MTEPSARSSAPSDARTRALSEVMGALADPTRLRILLTLAGRELGVTELWKYLHLSQPVASAHLAVLRAHRLVLTRRAGRQVFYRLAAERVSAAGNGAVRISAGGAAVLIDAAGSDVDAAGSDVDAAAA